MIAPQPAKTRAKAASPSATTRRESPDALLDLVADPPHRFQVRARGVLEVPVLVPLAGVDRARVAAAHGDDDVRLTHGVIRQRFREPGGDVDADFAHRLD